VPFVDAVVALILIKEDGRYLTQSRDEEPGIFCPDHWCLFGGAAEAGERPIQALLRELQNELSLCCDQPVFFTNFQFEKLAAQILRSDHLHLRSAKSEVARRQRNGGNCDRGFIA
jgi:8-oxo-dGTP pyrophosphatase MutT (NUDIX family)